MLEKDSTIIEETDNCGAAEPAEETASPQPQQTPKEQKATGGDTVRTVQKILAWILSAALLLVGIAAGALAIHIGMHYPGQKPILLTKPEAAIRQVSGMMEAICDGDYDKASTYLLGTPSLGVAEPPESPPGHFAVECVFGQHGVCAGGRLLHHRCGSGTKYFLYIFGFCQRYRKPAGTLPGAA